MDLNFRADDYVALSQVKEPGTKAFRKFRNQAIRAGALVPFGDVELLNKTVLLNYLTKSKVSRIEAREEAKKTQIKTGNPYSHVKTIGKLAQAEQAILKAVGSREKAIEILYKELDAESDDTKRSQISSKLGKKLDDKAKSEIKLDHIKDRRKQIESENLAAIEKGRKAKSKKTDSSKKTEDQDK